MNHPLKIAVIGLGNMGKHHVRNYNELEDAQLAAVCDVNPDIAKEFGQKFHCPAFSSVEQMLKSVALDGVSNIAFCLL